MIRNQLSTACLLAAMILGTPASFGNDLVDFLRAVNRSRHLHSHHGHGHHSRHSYHSRHSHHSRHGHHSRHAAHRVGSRHFHGYGYRPSHRSVSVHVGLGTRPPVYSQRPTVVDPLALAPSPSAIEGLPYDLGEIVTCDVPLEPHVRIHNADEIAPGAQPVIVAIRDPHLADRGSLNCIEKLAYVQVFAPPAPLREMTVSSCHTRIVLDYGDWEIKIRSGDDVIEVEYDD